MVVVFTEAAGDYSAFFFLFSSLLLAITGKIQEECF